MRGALAGLRGDVGKTDPRADKGPGDLQRLPGGVGLRVSSPACHGRSGEPARTPAGGPGGSNPWYRARVATRCRTRSGRAQLLRIGSPREFPCRSLPVQPATATLLVESRGIYVVGVATPDHGREYWRLLGLDEATSARGDDTKRRGQTGSSLGKSMSKPVPVRWYRRNWCGEHHHYTMGNQWDVFT